MRFANVEQLGAQGEGVVVGGDTEIRMWKYALLLLLPAPKGYPHRKLSEITLLVSCYVRTFAMKYQDSL